MGVFSKGGKTNTTPRSSQRAPETSTPPSETQTPPAEEKVKIQTPPAAEEKVKPAIKPPTPPAAEEKAQPSPPKPASKPPPQEKLPPPPLLAALSQPRETRQLTRQGTSNKIRFSEANPEQIMDRSAKFISMTPPASREHSRRGNSDEKDPEAELFRVENAIYENQLNALQARSLIHENGALIAKNYSSAFSGNRQLTNQNTEDLTRNRMAILDAMAADAENDLQVTYVEALKQQEKIDFMKHRSLLNHHVLELTLKMADVNALSLRVNKRVMETNEEIVNFNKEYIEENSRWIKTGLSGTDVTHEIVADLQKANASIVRKMMLTAGGNTAKLVDCIEEGEANRDSIISNEKDVYGRRDKIFANRQMIRSNQESVQSLLQLKSLIGRSAPTNGSGVIQGLFNYAAEQMCKCLAPEKAPVPDPDASESTLLESTRTGIAANRVQLFALEASIFDNRSNAYHARSLVQENAALIFKNYSSAFSGNRQLTNQNTDDLFRNRLAIVRRMGVDANDDVQAAYLQAVLYKQRITFLQHKASLNQHVLELTLSMAVVNAKHIEVNNRVMETNEEIVNFNHTYIAENKKWLSEGISLKDATPSKVSALVEANAIAIADLIAKAKADHSRVAEILSAAKGNHSSVMHLTEVVRARRTMIEKNRASIQDNQQAVAGFARAY